MRKLVALALALCMALPCGALAEEESVPQAILAATGQAVPDRLDRYVIMGELSLDGSVMPIRGALPIALKAKEEGFAGLILPAVNAREAAVVEGLEVIGVRSLTEVVGFLSGQRPLEP